VLLTGISSLTGIVAYERKVINTLLTLVGVTSFLSCFQVNAVNRDGETPVDILLRSILPADDEILDGHCCLYPASHCASTGGGGMDVVVDAGWTQLPRPLYQLLTAGAHGQLLERLVLHAMKEASLMLELCRLLVDLEKPAHYRLSGLLLQVSARTTPVISTSRLRLWFTCYCIWLHDVTINRPEFLLLFWHAALGVHSTICRHEPPRRAVLRLVKSRVWLSIIGQRQLESGCAYRT